MGDAAELVRQVAALLYVATAVVGLRWYLRRRAAASKWLAATFATLAAVVLAGIVAGDPRPRWLEFLLVAGITAYPYLLLRFAATFSDFPAPTWPVVTAVGVGLVAWGAALTPLPASGEPRGPGTTLFVVALVLYFVAISTAVTVRLWRAGAGQPTLARRRMRSMAVAALLLGLALVAAGTGDQHDRVRLGIQVLSLSTTLLFLTAFATPGVLRAAWRAAEEDQLYQAAVRLMGVTSAAEVATVLLPHVRRVLGARAARLTANDGTVLGLHGDVAGAPGLRLPLSDAVLEVWPSPYTPFFGAEEERLGRRLTLLADLALARAELLGRELRAREETENANRELEAFVYSASHDLKTPLLALLGFLDLLGETGVPDGDATFYVARMRANALYMQELIADLLELSRVGRVDITPDDVDLDGLVGTVAHDVAERHPGTTVVVDGTLPRLWANPTRVRQLLTNVIDNAAKYSGRERTTVTIDTVPTAAGTELRVRDDGAGIPTEHHERVFGVFERLETREGGTGIGLALCRKITEELGGSIRFVASDAGADLRITLPAAATIPAETTTRPEVRA